jgi:hypothetical protein
MKMRTRRVAWLGLLIGLLMTQAANADIVNIDAAVSGCKPCNGNPHENPGDIVSDVISPVQLVVPVGTYKVTNGNGKPGANPNFISWNFNSSGANWVWSFIIINDANKEVLMDGCCGPIFNTQAGAANQSFAVNFSQSLTLTQQTTLDFVTEDYFPPDNLGGMAVSISPASTSVPEPASWTLVGVALVSLVFVRHRSRIGA